MVSQRFRRPGLLVLCLFLGTSAFAGRWGSNKLWKDGRAEVAVYDAERVVYGKVRRFRESLVTVREDFIQDTLVKADNPKKQKTFRVFKLNVIQKFETENYPYSYLTSVFIDAKDTTRVVKMTIGSQEWCGNTFKLFKRPLKETQGLFEMRSYFDGEADQDYTMEIQEGDMFVDQLPLSLRALSFEAGFQKKTRLWDNMTSNRGVQPGVSEATISVVGEELIRCRAGSISSWKVLVKSSAGEDTYWFDKKYPHLLTKMVKADGQKRILHGRARWSYWDRRIPMPNIIK